MKGAVDWPVIAQLLRWLQVAVLAQVPLLFISAIVLAALPIKSWKLIWGLSRHSEEILRAMKGEGGWKSIAPFLRWLQVFFPPEVLQSFILAIVLAALLIGAVFAVHLLISLVRKRRTRVFISFQHEREAIADTLAAEMTKCGIRPKKLPFVESPDHNTLIDQVDQEIHACDIFVCVPGNRPSFVDNEVGKASFGKKPVLFVFVEADAPPHLPNTAKKGYPVFALEGLQREGFRTLANFCSYLAADWRSTVRLYAAVFHHLQACAQIAVAVYIVSIVIFILINVMGSFRGPDVANRPERTAAQIAEETARKLITREGRGSLLGSPRTLASKFLVPTLILFLIPYGLFFIKRLVLRAQVRRAISEKRFFRDTFIPETLAYSLTRADLLKILYYGDIVAHHESGRPGAKSL